MEKSQIVCHLEKSLNYTIYDVKWIPHSAKFVVTGGNANGTGALEIYKLTGKEMKLVHKNDKSSSIKCSTFGASPSVSRQLATGNFDGQLQIWDLEEDGSKQIFSEKHHQGIINCIAGIGGQNIGYGAPEIVTGGRDGSVKIWDIRQSTPVVDIDPQDSSSSRDCWCVAFGNNYNEIDKVVAAGFDNGDVKLFDLRTMKVIFEKNLKNGVCGIEFDRPDISMNKLVVTTLESNIHVLNCQSLVDSDTTSSETNVGIMVEKAHKSTIWAVKHLPQNREIFMSCGGNGTLNLWKYLYPTSENKETAIGTLDLLQDVLLSTQPVSSFDWCREKSGLAVCGSFDQTVRVLIVTKL